MEQIIRRQRIRRMELSQIGPEQERARHRHPHHLMRVDGDGIRQVRPIEPFLRQRRREDGRTAPGGVDVQPEVVRAADLGDGAQGVVAAQDGRAGGGVDVEGGFVFGVGLGDEGCEGRGVHAARCAGCGHRPDGRGAEAEHLGGFFDAVVAVSAGEEDQVVGG